MYINTVKSLEDSFTMFKRVVYAYVWVHVTKYAHTETEESHKFIFTQLVIIAEDESTIIEKAYAELSNIYPESSFIITNIIPFKETLTRQLRKEFTDVLEKLY